MSARIARRLGLALLSLGLAVPPAAAAERAQTPTSSPAQAPAGQDPPATSAPPVGRPGAGRAGRGLPPVPDSMNVAQVERFFDGYMINEARRVLQLTDEQYFTIGPRLERLQELRRQVQRQRRQVLGELREMLRPEATVDDAALTAKVKALDEVPSQFVEPIRKAYADIDSALTPRQRARFRTFEEMMEQQKLDLLARARQIRPAGRQ